MWEYQSFWTMRAKKTCGEPILKLTQSLLFRMCSVFYHVKPDMKTIGYEIPLLILYQRGIIALQNVLVTNFSQNEMVWDMNKEYVWCSSSYEHSDISAYFLKIPMAYFGNHLFGCH